LQVTPPLRYNIYYIIYPKILFVNYSDGETGILILPGYGATTGGGFTFIVGIDFDRCINDSINI